ncbi:M55 family metallopeptidase [Paenibacillus koleovorans]|uniref:M55 family metallopeptidase n=1 Tax=Paenibacillus koleovorans TaxID=121608 RepID=UPI000FD84178|nr:M55 family metallopeptidase [Paenibacillus koleovorans]
MNVYILTDMEGISMVFLKEQCQGGHAFYPRYQEILTAEVNAAVEGAIAAGATRIVVNDGHGGNQDYNILCEKLNPIVEIERPDSGKLVLPALDDSFHAMIMVGYHSMAGTPNSVIPHTQNSTTILTYWINGRPIGEIEQMSLLAGQFGVPVMYVSGDRAAIDEARQVLGEDLPATVIKQGHPNGRTTSIHPQEAVKRIRADVEAALKQPRRAPHHVEGPYDMRITYKCIESANNHAARADITRYDDFTVGRTVTEVNDILL